MTSAPRRERPRPIRWLMWRLLLLLPNSTRFALWRALVLLPCPLRQSIWQSLVRRDRDLNPLSFTAVTPTAPPTGIARLKSARPGTYDVVVFATGPTATHQPWIETMSRAFAATEHRVFIVAAGSA